MSGWIDIALVIGGMLAAAAVATVGVIGLVVWLAGRRRDESEAWPPRAER